VTYPPIRKAKLPKSHVVTPAEAAASRRPGWQPVAVRVDGRTGRCRSRRKWSRRRTRQNPPPRWL